MSIFFRGRDGLGTVDSRTGARMKTQHMGRHRPRFVPWVAALLFTAALTSAVVAVVAPLPAGAYHERAEPSDGTVRSFIKVWPPVQPAAFEFRDGEGSVLDLTRFRGKVVLLNIWATWCPPCLREMPALDRLQARLGTDDVVVVPLSIDHDGRAVVSRFYARLGVRHLGIYVDPVQASGKGFPVDVLPATFILDRQGRMVSYLRSFVDWDAPEAAVMLRDYAARTAK